MTSPKKQSLSTLLQELQRKTRKESLTEDEQRAIMQVVTDLLITCGKRVERPLSGRDLQEVRGHYPGKRALEVAAAGGHSLLLSGPHLAGKSLLAQTLPSILPATAVPYPFRAPDSTLPSTAFIGEPTTPGELTLAHGGILFLKSVHTFDRTHLAALRHAVETRVVVFEEQGLVFPANFLLVATTIPCPCGFFNDPIRECTCSAERIQQHIHHMKGVIDACIDIHIEVPHVREEMLSRSPEERSSHIQDRVKQARARQQRRYGESPHFWVNADLASVEEVQQACQMDTPAEKLFRAALQQLRPSPASILRLQKVARTIADLGGSETIAAHHVAEAIQYRPRF